MSDTPPPVTPRPRLGPFLRGVLIGTVVLNAATLIFSLFREAFTGFAMALAVTTVTAVVFAFRREFAVAAGLVVALVASPLLAFPSCSLTFKGW